MTVLFKTPKNIEKIFKQICKEYSCLHPYFYNLITFNKELQKYINQEVIEEFFENESNLQLYWDEIQWVASGGGYKQYFSDFKNIIHETLSLKYKVECVTKLHRFDCDIIKLTEL